MTNDCRPDSLLDWRPARAQTTRLPRVPNIAGQPPHLNEPEQIGHNGLSAPVLVHTAGMQAIAAASRFQVDQQDRQGIPAEKPLERTLSIAPPPRVSVRSPCREARGDGGRRLQRLLIERPGWHP